MTVHGSEWAGWSHWWIIYPAENRSRMLL